MATTVPETNTEFYIPSNYTRRACCDECGRKITLTTMDADGVLIGDECTCGYYVTRYIPGMAVK